MEWQPMESAPMDGTRVILLLTTAAGDLVQIGHKCQKPNSGWYIEPSGYWSSVRGWIPLPKERINSALIEMQEHASTENETRA
jgi:hypothetical protein